MSLPGNGSFALKAGYYITNQGGTAEVR